MLHHRRPSRFSDSAPRLSTSDNDSRISGGDAADAAFDSRVLKSSRFAVQGKRIAVAAAAAAAEEGEAEEAAERRPRKKKQKKSKGGIE